MIHSTLVREIEKLSFEDRLSLVQAIWDSVEDEANRHALSPAQIKELNRRLEKYGDSTEGIPWEEVRKELLQREKDEKASPQSTARGSKRPKKPPTIGTRPSEKDSALSSGRNSRKN